MFKQYFHDINELDNAVLERRPFISKHINHVVTDFFFDFFNVVESVNVLLQSMGEPCIHQEQCEYIWTQFHIKRYLSQLRPIEPAPLPFRPSSAQQKLLPLEEEIKRNPALQTQFNILRDKVRLNDRKKKESQLLQSLESVSEAHSEAPLQYKVEFDEKGQAVLQEKELTQSDVLQIMSKNSFFSKTIDNFINEFEEIQTFDKFAYFKKPQKDSESGSGSGSGTESEDSEQDYFEQQRKLLKSAK